MQFIDLQLRTWLLQWKQIIIRIIMSSWWLGLKTLEGQTKPSWTRCPCKGCSTSLPALSWEFPCAHSHSHSALVSPVTMATCDWMSHAHLFHPVKVNKETTHKRAHLADLQPCAYRSMGFSDDKCRFCCLSLTPVQPVAASVSSSIIHE